METEWFQLGVNAVVAASSAWLGVRFGIQKAMDQFKQDQVLNRRLEWSLKVFRLIGRFRFAVGKFVAEAYLKNNPANSPEPILELEKCQSSFDECLNEAIFVPDQRILRELTYADAQLETLLADVKKSNYDIRRQKFNIYQRLEVMQRRLAELGSVVAWDVRFQLKEQNPTTSRIFARATLQRSSSPGPPRASRNRLAQRPPQNH